MESMEVTMASINKALGTLHKLQCSVSTFTLPSQMQLLERINEFVDQIDTVQSTSQECNLQIPAEVIKFIDEGKNPDEFTKDLLNHCIQRNQATKGKVDVFKALRKNLLEGIEEAFPEETEGYRAIRTASLMESRRAMQAATAPPLSNGDAKVKSEH